MEIIIDNKLNIPKMCKGVLSGGHLVAIYRECDKIFAENILRDLVRDYRVSKKIFPTMVENNVDTVSDVLEVEDDVRMMLVFGGSNMIEVAKDASTMLGIPLIVVLTTPTRVDTCSTYIFNGGELDVKRTVEPKLLLAMQDRITNHSGFERLIGDIVESILVEIDEMIYGILNGSGFCRTNVDELLKVIDNMSENDKAGILKTCYNIKRNRRSIVNYIAEVLSYNSSAVFDKHNLKFALTYTILLLYWSYLSYDGDDLILPPDIVESARRVNRLFGMDVSSIVTSYKGIDALSYIKANYVIKEYKSELLEVIKDAISTMQKLSKVYRRVSQNAGYNMYDRLSIDSMLESISLLSIKDENTLLSVIKTSGMLEHYISDYKVS